MKYILLYLLVVKFFNGFEIEFKANVGQHFFLKSLDLLGVEEDLERYDALLKFLQLLIMIFIYLSEDDWVEQTILLLVNFYCVEFILH